MIGPVELTVERADWMVTPGRIAVLVVGPFTFGLNTADGLTLAFGMRLGRWSFEWSAGPAQGLL